MHTTLLIQSIGLCFLKILGAFGLIVVFLILDKTLHWQVFFGEVSTQRFLMKCVVLGGFWLMAFAWAFPVETIARREVGINPVSAEQLLAQLKEYFGVRHKDDSPVFTVTDIPGGMRVSFNTSIGQNLLVLMNYQKINYTLDIHLDPGATKASLASQVVDEGGYVSVMDGEAGYSMQFRGGQQFEWTSKAGPSLVVENGRVDLEKVQMTFDSRLLMDPAFEMVKKAGWDVALPIMGSGTGQAIMKAVRLALMVIGAGMMLAGIYSILGPQRS